MQLIACECTGVQLATVHDSSNRVDGMKNCPVPNKRHVNSRNQGVECGGKDISRRD